MSHDDLTGSTPFSAIISAIENDWLAQARPEQLPPEGDWSIWLILAGRGFGKTRAGAEWVRNLAESEAVGRIALVGPTAADVRDVMVEGDSGLLGIAPDSFRPLYEPSKRRLTWPNGVVATMYSSEEPERLRGPQHGAAWCDELGAWRNARETWDQLQFGMRLGTRPRQLVSTTPRPSKLMRELIQRQDIVVTRGRTYDNAANLAPSFLTEIVRRYEGTRLGRQELNAELLFEVQGALWNADMIDATRRPAENAHMIEFERIVVAIDPAISTSETSDETGIVIAALGYDGRGYVLEDLSGKFSPTEWATRAVAAYRRWGADRIIAESNQGGEMVENTLRTVDRNVPVRLVHAKRGKFLRAEPVSSLYEQGRVSHVGAFSDLEDQMTSFAQGSTDSPDRLDALVYALSDLMVTPQTSSFVFA